MVNRKPYVFQKDIYAITSVEGALIIFFLKDVLSSTMLVFISFIIVFGTRMMCYIKHISLPVFSEN